MGAWFYALPPGPFDNALARVEFFLLPSLKQNPP
jgi:hypothetical protein